MMIFLGYILAGVFAGLVAGLLGVGGGIIVVPVLIMLFEAQGFSPGILTHMAIATSLATIVFTSLSSIFNHHRMGSVDWYLVRNMSVGIAMGAVAGVITVTHIDGYILKKLIGIFAIVVALRMFMKRKVNGQMSKPGRFQLAAVGSFIGWVSAMFGIGGGTLSVPYLSRLSMAMKQVIGTAAACGMPIAFVGAATNMLVGSGMQGRPDWSIGLVYLPALFGIVVASVFFAGVGARLAHKISAESLRSVFAIALACVGLKFLI